MIRRLVLMRHAKSDWSRPLSDRDRPLAPRGRRQAPSIAPWLTDSGLVPQVVLCSPARRAVDTWAAIAAGLSGSSRTPEVLLLEDVYTFDGVDLLEALASLSLAHPQARCVGLVGHNPALEELTADLTGRPTRLKTSSVAVIELDVPGWSQVRPGDGRLVIAGRPADGLDPLDPQDLGEPAD